MTSKIAHALFVGFVGMGCMAMRPMGTTTKPDPENPDGKPAGKTLEVVGAGASLEQLTRDPASETGPVLTPDKAKILFTKRSGTTMVIVGIDPEAEGGESVYTSPTASAWQPRFAPDGKDLFLVSNATGGWAIVKTTLQEAGGPLRIVVPQTTAANIRYPSITPDGKQIYFSAAVGGGGTMMRIDMDGSGLTVLGPGSYPTLSPDGTTLAFCRKVQGIYQIYTMEAGTARNLTQLTAIDGHAIAPTWSPDGRWLLFASSLGATAAAGSRAGFTYNIFAIQADGTQLTKLTSGVGQAIDPHWGSDGWVYFAYAESGNNHDIWRFKPTALMDDEGGTGQ